jgi:hypothetical protein
MKSYGLGSVIYTSIILGSHGGDYGKSLSYEYKTRTAGFSSKMEAESALEKW